MKKFPLYVRNTIDKQPFSCYNETGIIYMRCNDMKGEMKKMSGTKKNQSNLTTAALYVIVGILFCIFRAGLLNWLLTIAGILFLVVGIMDLIKKDVTGGVVSIVIGLVILLGGWLFLEIVLLIFGILVAAKGVLALLAALKPKKKNIWEIVFSAVTIFVGVMLVVSKWAMVDGLFVVIGILMVIDGVVEMIGIFGTKK